MATVVGSGAAPGEDGVRGESDLAEGVEGISHAAAHAAVLGTNDNQTDQAGAGVHGKSRAAGVLGESGTWHGVVGIAQSPTGGGFGVYGESLGTGVAGVSKNWNGVYGETTAAAPTGTAGLWGDGKANGFGVKGHALHPSAAGVAGFHLADTGDVCAGVLGNSKHGQGLRGEGAIGVSGVGQQWIGVYGETHAPTDTGAAGVWGDGLATGDGVKGVANSPQKAAVAAFNLGGGLGVFAEGSPAGRFVGNVEVGGQLSVSGDIQVTGDIRLLGADCAENFDVVDDVVVEPGAVMVVSPDGRLEPSTEAYDTRAVGIVSGAGAFRPGVVLDSQETSSNRVPIGMVGKVYCKVDASTHPITAGDLLVSSAIPGHAMKAADRARSHGAVIGKALASLRSGPGLIPVLVVNQ